MVDLGISRTQDLQSPLPASLRAAAGTPARQEQNSRPQAAAPARRPAEEAPPAEEAGPANLEKEVEHLNSLLGSNTKIRFVINRKNQDVYVEVVDSTSNEVLRKIPSSEVPDVASKLSGGGVLVDKES